MNFTDWLANRHNFNLAKERSVYLTEMAVNTKVEDEQVTDMIMNACLKTGISYRDLIGEGRKRDVVEVRHILMYLLRKKYKGATLRQIGLYFGGRDHSTIIHAEDKVTDMLDIGDIRTMQLVQVLEGVVNGG